MSSPEDQTKRGESGGLTLHLSGAELSLLRYATLAAEDGCRRNVEEATTMADVMLHQHVPPRAKEHQRSQEWADKASREADMQEAYRRLRLRLEFTDGE